MDDPLTTSISRVPALSIAAERMVEPVGVRPWPSRPSTAMPSAGWRTCHAASPGTIRVLCADAGTMVAAASGAPAEMGLQHGTIRQYMTAIFSVFGVHSRTQLIRAVESMSAG